MTAPQSPGAAGTAGDGFRIPEPRKPAARECDDPTEPGARRSQPERTTR